MPTKRETKNHGKRCWELDYGLDLTGKRRRAFFASNTEADDAIKAYDKEVKKCGEYWARLKPLERQRTVTILQDIATKGLTLERVWADHQRWREENGNTAITPQPFSTAVDAFKQRKREAGKTKRYIRDAVGILEKFGQGREKQNIHEIMPTELEAWINEHKNPNTGKKWGLSSKKTVHALFSSLWQVAVAKGWCSMNIVDRLEPITRPGRVVAIYPNEVILHLMAACMSNEATQQVLAPLALGAFGCMRPEEIQSAKAISEGLPESVYFGWDDIDLDHGLCRVRREIAKTGDERTIRLQPNAVEWLRKAKKLGNPLPPENETRLVDQCCELIGLTDWIRDGLRKNCATHLRWVYKNDFDVVKDMGNSVRILLKHYADLHTPEEVSMDYWKITLDRVEKYLKTKEWRKVISDAEERRARLASGTATSEN
jgi:integrase